MDKQEIICESWRKNERYLMAVALNLTHNLHDAEDLYQDTILHALRKRHLLHTDNNVGGWLSLMMRRLFYSKRKRAKKRAERAHRYIGEMLRRGAHAQDPRILERLAQRDEAEQLLQLLPDTQAVSLRLVGEGFGYQDIADHLQIPLGTVMSRLFRGRQAIAKAV